MNAHTNGEKASARRKLSLDTWAVLLALLLALLVRVGIFKHIPW